MRERDVTAPCFTDGAVTSLVLTAPGLTALQGLTGLTARNNNNVREYNTARYYYSVRCYYSSLHRTALQALQALPHVFSHLPHRCAERDGVR